MNTLENPFESTPETVITETGEQILTPEEAAATTVAETKGEKAVLAATPTATLSGHLNRLAPWHVVQTNPNSKGGFVIKMQRTLVLESKIFGAKEKKETSYISVPANVPVGTVVTVAELREFQLYERPMINPSTGEQFTGYWWHLKQS